MPETEKHGGLTAWIIALIFAIALTAGAAGAENPLGELSCNEIVELSADKKGLKISKEEFKRLHIEAFMFFLGFLSAHDDEMQSADALSLATHLYADFSFTDLCYGTIDEVKKNPQYEFLLRRPVWFLIRAHATEWRKLNL